MITTLYNDKESMLSWLGNAPSSWKQFLQEEYTEQVRQLKKETDLMKLGRAQGTLSIVDRLLGLKEELNEVVGKK